MWPCSEQDILARWSTEHLSDLSGSVILFPVVTTKGIIQLSMSWDDLVKNCSDSVFSMKLPLGWCELAESDHQSVNWINIPLPFLPRSSIWRTLSSRKSSAIVQSKPTESLWSLSLGTVFVRWITDGRAGLQQDLFHMSGQNLFSYQPSLTLRLG